ncbi:hypothetical protein [Vibrio taketomensis]|uniref:hypothetical protein n=1 Tax=Vibrio taketomensis TaxID=2572923 RepID=UPI00138A44D8|nr:hypothetical protein [Vibrio taketomensis]
MITANDFEICDHKIRFKKDEYPTDKIKDARVKTNQFKDHILRVISIGLITASVVWMICPESLGLFTAPIALSIGTLVGLSSARKYELQIEFEHVDETGLQWVAIAKSNRTNDKKLFEQQVATIQAQLYPSFNSSSSAVPPLKSKSV